MIDVVRLLRKRVGMNSNLADINCYIRQRGVPRHTFSSFIDSKGRFFAFTGTFSINERASSAPSITLQEKYEKEADIKHATYVPAKDAVFTYRVEGTRRR